MTEGSEQTVTPEPQIGGALAEADALADVQVTAPAVVDPLADIQPTLSVESGPTTSLAPEPNKTEPDKKESEAPTPIKDLGLLEKTAEPGAYVPQPDREMTEKEYIADLAARIAKSNFQLTQVAHKDYVKMLRDGFINNENKTLISTGQQLEINESQEAPLGTYYELAKKVEE